MEFEQESAEELFNLNLISLNIPDAASNALLIAIEEKVQHFLDTDPNLLFSYMYRLDVEEHHIQHVLQHSPPEDLAHQLAILIYTRQLKRLETKKQFGPQGTDNWIDA